MFQFSGDSIRYYFIVENRDFLLTIFNRERYCATEWPLLALNILTKIHLLITKKSTEIGKLKKLAISKTSALFISNIIATTNRKKYLQDYSLVQGVLMWLFSLVSFPILSWNFFITKKCIVIKNWLRLFECTVKPVT